MTTANARQTLLQRPSASWLKEGLLIRYPGLGYYVVGKRRVTPSLRTRRALRASQDAL